MTSINNIEVPTEIVHWTEKAFSMYRFLAQLPSPLSNILFKRIIDESYYIVSSYPRAEQIDSALEGICDAIDLDCNDFNPLLDYFDIRHIEKDEIDSTIATNDRHEIEDKLKSRIRLRELPAKGDLVDSYPCFSQTVIDDCVLINYKEIVRDKLNRMIAKYGKEYLLSPRSTTFTPFQTLGYKTSFHEWFNDDSDRHFDNRFFRWYCKGDLLSIFFDTIFRGESTSVSQVLWQYVNNACEKDPYLRDIVQEQYDDYRKFSPSIPPHEFVCKGEKPKGATTDSLKLLPALPRFAKDDKKNGFLSENEMYTLYEELVRNGYLDSNDTPVEAFLRVFSGSGKTARPIKWLGSQKELATFLYIAQGETTSKKYSKTAAGLFLQKNGKPCKVTTLNQPDYDNKTFRNIRDEILKRPEL